MAAEKVSISPEAAEVLREQIDKGKREGFGDLEEYRGTGAALMADDRVTALKCGTVTEDSRTA